VYQKIPLKCLCSESKPEWINLRNKSITENRGEREGGMDSEREGERERERGEGEIEREREREKQVKKRKKESKNFIQKKKNCLFDLEFLEMRHYLTFLIF